MTKIISPPKDPLYNPSLITNSHPCLVCCLINMTYYHLGNHSWSNLRLLLRLKLLAGRLQCLDCYPINNTMNLPISNCMPGCPQPCLHHGCSNLNKLHSLGCCRLLLTLGPTGCLNRHLGNCLNRSSYSHSS